MNFLDNNFSIFQIAGYLSAIVMLWSFVPYIRDIFKGNTRPERASWLIWSMLGAISFFSLFSEGASYSLFMPAAQGIGDLFIFILAIRYGVGGFMKRDVVAMIGVFVGLLLWYLMNNAIVALLTAIFIDGIGTTLTAIKTYETPETENLSSWFFVFLAGFFGCISVGSFNVILLIFPFYVSLAGLAVVTALSLGFRSKKLKVKNDIQT